VSAVHSATHEGGWRILTFVLGLLGALQVPPLGAHQAAQLPEGEVRVSGLDDGPHLAAEQDVAAHVDLPLGALLLGQALDGLRRGLEDAGGERGEADTFRGSLRRRDDERAATATAKVWR